MSQQTIVGVNFNGTLVDENEFGYLVAIPGAKEAMHKLKSLNFKIVVYSRMICSDDLKGQEANKIISTLKALGIPYDEVYVGDRLSADFYIDDRAISFKGNWSQTLEELELAVITKEN